MAFNIGSHHFKAPAILAPMAGVTDWPFRQIARDCGAQLCIAEMLTAQTDLWKSSKSSTRLPSLRDPAPRPVQIAGSEPLQMAEAAKKCESLGAGIIDINMGCPAKKVYKQAAGSALLADEKRVFKILQAVVEAVDVPVTLKTRTGTDNDNKNILGIAKTAEQIGIQAISIHGRTRACRFNGQAEYQTIKTVVDALEIPVFANGDITTPQQAASVLEYTGATAVMIGRGAWGNPWLLQQCADYIKAGAYVLPSSKQKHQVILKHLNYLCEYYPELQSVRLARKQIDRYLADTDTSKEARQQFFRLDTAAAQIEFINQYFARVSQAA